jgi:hypothetical protein
LLVKPNIKKKEGNFEWFQNLHQIYYAIYSFPNFSFKFEYICLQIWSIILNMPREIITIQIGQCGNQSKNKFI